ncbi:MAG: LytR C-terminal domain-containing protein, partial [Candidatus Pacebacteria bacterium]|nr:LytR C-terminal domain-containing protein [Candidatus Paceibacterota bacterium]
INQISFFPFLVAKSITKPKKPTLLIFLKNKVQFLAYIWEDRVLTYGLQNLDTLKDDISNFLNLIKIKYDLEVKDIISISDRDLSSLKIKMESVNLNLKNLEFTSLISDFKYQERKEIKKEEADEIKGKENQSTEDKTEKTDSNLPKLLLLLVASILLMGIVFLPKILGDKEAPPSEIIEETSVATLTPTPLPSPSPQFFPNLYSVQVLNGTNIGGLATTTKELLEENGYEDVEIGNAPEDYVLTEIITDNDEELIKNLSEILSLDFEINSTPSSTTSLSPDLDAIVILGNKK